jgi:hypothetical protein
MAYAKTLGLCSSMWAAVFLAGPAVAAPGDKANLSGLTDVSFGTIVSFQDQVLSQSVCAYSASSPSGYSGSGPGGTFSLSSGSAQLAYEVLWNTSPNQTGGTSLAAGTQVSGFVSSASQKTCNNGPSSSASLIVVLRSAALSNAQAGNYVGTLQVTIAPE